MLRKSNTCTHCSGKNLLRLYLPFAFGGGIVLNVDQWRGVPIMASTFNGLQALQGKIRQGNGTLCILELEEAFYPGRDPDMHEILWNES